MKAKDGQKQDGWIELENNKQAIKKPEYPNRTQMVCLRTH